MGKKFNKSLLNEELKKFRLLSEYKFYTEEPERDEKGELILGSGLDSGLDEADEDPQNQEQPEGAPVDAPVDDSKTAANQQDQSGDENTFSTETGDETAPEGGEEMGDETAPEGDEAMGGEEMVDEPIGDETGVEDTTGGEDEVEVDVTSLVQGSEEAKEAATSASQKTDELLAKFSDLEARISKMDAITNKINDLEQEIVKRNPTPVEKLEMRSLDSYPYNIKLTDYFKDIDGYDTGSNESKQKEYVLTKDDISNDYLDQSIKNSFSVPEDYEEEDYEEEDI